MPLRCRMRDGRATGGSACGTLLVPMVPRSGQTTTPLSHTPLLAVGFATMTGGIFVAVAVIVAIGIYSEDLQ